MWLLWGMLAGAAETVVVTEDVQSLRFPDDEKVQGPFLSAGDEVEVVFEEGDRVRIRKGTTWGWIPRGVTAQQAPAEEETE